MAILGVILVMSMVLAACASATPTAAPVENTAAPAAPTTAPVENTAAPAAPTAAPAENTAAPAASTPAAQGGGDITLAWMGPLTGPDGVDGQGAAKAGQLAIDLANQAGGICGGRKLVFKPYDTKADPKEGANIATLLANDPSVLGVMSDYNSSVFLAGKPIFNDAKLVAISYYTTAPNITKDGPYSYRIYPPGENMAKFFIDLLNKKGVKKIAQIYENEDFGQLLSKVVIDEAAKVGMTVVDSEPVLKDQTDISAPVSKIKAAAPEAIIAWTQYTVGSYFMKQSKDMGLDVPVYGLDGLLAPEFIKLAGDAAEGVYTVGSYDINSKDPIVSSFVTAFRAANNGVDPNNPAGYVFDDATILINALKGSNCAGREAVKQWLDANFVGKTMAAVTGNIAMDENRDRTFAPGMYTLIVVKDGKFVVAQ
jgi:branched-chain amino acid transport system substrate-binding protein